MVELPQANRKFGLIFFYVMFIAVFIISLLISYNCALPRLPKLIWGDVYPNLLPSGSEFLMNLKLSLSGYGDGYLRSVKGYSIFLLFSLLFVSIGKVITRKILDDNLQPFSVYEKGALYYILGSLCMSLLWFLFGTFGWLQTWIAVGVCLVSPLISYLVFLKGKSKDYFKSQLTEIISPIARAGLSEKIYILGFIFLLLTASAMAIKHQAFGDTLTYTMGLPNYYASQGVVAPHPYNTQSYLSENLNMLTLWALLLDSEVAAALTVWGMSLALISLIFGFTARRFSTLTATLSVGLLVSSNSFLWFLTCVKPDFVTAAFLMAHYLLLIEAVDNDSERQDNNWRMFFLSGLFVGGAIGHKILAIAPAILSFLFLLGYDIRNRYRGRRKSGVVLFFLIGITLASAPWFIRNLAYTGNPIYPFYQKLFGSERIKGWHEEFGGQYESYKVLGLKGLVSYARTLALDGGSGSSPSNWSSLILFILLFPLCIFWKASLGYRIAISAALITWVVMLFQSFVFRYHISVIVPLSVLTFAFCFDHFYKSQPFKKAIKFAGLALIGLSIFNMILSTGALILIRTSLGILLSGYSQGNFYQGLGPFGRQDEAWLVSYLINTKTDKNDAVLLASGNPHFLKRKFIATSDYDKNVIQDFAEQVQDSDQLALKIKEEGYKHIIFEQEFDRIAMENIMRGDIYPGVKTLQVIFDMFDKHMDRRLHTPRLWLKWYTFKGGEANAKDVDLFTDDVLTRFPAVSIDYAKKLIYGTAINGSNAITYLESVAVERQPERPDVIAFYRDRFQKDSLKDSTVDPQGGFQILQRIASLPVAPRNKSLAYMEMAIMLDRAGQSAAAETYRTSMIQASINDPLVYEALAQYFIGRNDPQRVRDYLRQAIRIGGEKIRMRNQQVEDWLIQRKS